MSPTGPSERFKERARREADVRSCVTLAAASADEELARACDNRVRTILRSEDTNGWRDAIEELVELAGKRTLTSEAIAERAETYLREVARELEPQRQYLLNALHGSHAPVLIRLAAPYLDERIIPDSTCSVLEYLVDLVLEEFPGDEPTGRPRYVEQEAVLAAMEGLVERAGTHPDVCHAFCLVLNQGELRPVEAREALKVLLSHKSLRIVKNAFHEAVNSFGETEDGSSLHLLKIAIEDALKEE